MTGLLHHTRDSLESYSRSGALRDNILMEDSRWGWCRVLGDQWILVDTHDIDISPWLIKDGFWESWVTLFISNRVKPGDRCIDIGANYGYYSLLFNKLGAEFIAIEANIEIYSKLLHTVSRVGGVAWNNAIYSHDGALLSLKGTVNHDGNSSVMEYMGSPSGRKYSKEIESVTLDTIAGDSKVDFVKVDVEGAEYEFWKGAHNTLIRNPDIKMVIEFSSDRYNGDAEEFINSIISYGFDLYIVGEQGEAIPTTPNELLKPHKNGYVDLYIERPNIAWEALTDAQLKPVPELITDDHGGKQWWLNGQFHRIDGPAIELPDGTKEWCQHGQLHREDGPAIIHPDGYQAWCQHGQFHRADGPAVEWSDGSKEWWLFGIKTTEKNIIEYNRLNSSY